MDRRTIQRRLAKEGRVALPTIPKADAPIDEIIGRLAKDTARKRTALEAASWQRVHVNDKLPIGILWFGDPHLGTSCRWDRLQRDVAHVLTAPGLYAANLGDTANYWSGSLIRLAAEEDISRKTERRLARWFLAETGIPWLLWIMGNHDEWHDSADFMREMNIAGRVSMHDWDAKISLCFPVGQPVKVHIAHDFPGHSMWNKTHGPSRAAQLMSDADLYVCGHKHDWGMQQFEIPERKLCPVAVRARGYKFGDKYARRLGFAEAQHGHSVLTIICPTVNGPGKVLPFMDIDQGVKVLSALRGGK